MQIVQTKYLFISLICWIRIGYAQAQTLPVGSTTVSDTWLADKGNGEYINPVLHADYSDPDVIRVGSDYYLTASSFNCMPGLPILHSKDLVNWRIINHALPRMGEGNLYNLPRHGKGVWAPSIAYYNKCFYIYYPDPDFGIYMIKATDPAGKWTRPVLVLPGKGMIDPASFKDDDGQMYLAIGWAGSRAGVNSLLTIYKLNADGSYVTDDGKHVYDGHEADHTVEGPKLYKRNGYYYIFAPAGGVATGWQLALRSKNIYGPYERKIVLEQGNTDVNGPHQGAWVQTPSGKHWFLHFQDKGLYGRVLHLQPMKWVNDWPVIGVDKDGNGIGEPVAQYKKPLAGIKQVLSTPGESDEFNTDTPGLQWQWQANPMIQWYALLKRSGYLRLFAYPSDSGSNLSSVPNLLLQKFPAPSFTATAKLKWTIEWNEWQGKKAGLIIMGTDYAYPAVSKNDKGFLLSQTVCFESLEGKKEVVVDTKPLKDSVVYLRVKVSAPRGDCSFSYSEDGAQFKPIGNPFTARAGKWIGAKVGLFSTATPVQRIGGYADIDWFRVTGDKDSLKR